MHESFSPLPFSSDYFRHFRIIPVSNSYHVYIFHIYHSAFYRLYISLSYHHQKPQHQPSICRFKAFISSSGKDIGVMLKTHQRTLWSRLDGLECCGYTSWIGRTLLCYHTGDLMELFTVTGCYSELSHHVGDLIYEEFNLHTFLCFLCT